MKSRQRNLQHNLRQNNFLKFLHYLNKGRKDRNALRPRGPFLFRSAGKGSKRDRFRTALRQRKDSATIKAVRRDAQKLAASRRSNNLCARFFTARDAMKKSPHEPRRKILRALPRPPESFLSRRQLAVQVICVEAYFGDRGGHSPTRVSLASFSLHRAKRMKSRQRNLYFRQESRGLSPQACTALHSR